MINQSFVKFVRLLAEINFTGLPEEISETLRESMGCDQKYIDDVLAEAEQEFEKLKPYLQQLSEPKPLNHEQIQQQMKDAGEVRHIVSVSVNTLIEETVEELLETIEEKTVGDNEFLSDMQYTSLFEHDGNVYFLVTGDADVADEDDDDFFDDEDEDGFEDDEEYSDLDDDEK